MSSPIAFNTDEARQMMKRVLDSLPNDVEVYLVGGALRNAFIKTYLDETWIQRDYDQVITKGSTSYFAYLESLGFRTGSIDNDHQKVMAKQLFEDGEEISYHDNLVFDMHIADGTTIEDNLQYSTALSINGFGLNLRSVFDDDWEQKVVALPGALDSIKRHQIELNSDGYASESNYFFALLRFMGAGFAAPPRADVLRLLKTIETIEDDRYDRNIPKLVNYVGSEEKVRQLVDSLRIEGLDIFDQTKTKEIAKKL
jgi:hypothetical protein